MAHSYWPCVSAFAFLVLASCETTGVSTAPTEPVHSVASNGVMTIGEGPIWDQEDAVAKCNDIAERNNGTWTGTWSTTVASKMSICEIAPKVTGFDAAPKVFYFEAERAILSSKTREDLNIVAEALRHEPRNIRLAGHTDERGERAANLALGEKRAQSVMNYLVSHGVDPDRIAVVSYGEESPDESGSNEQAWAKNNRVELK